MPDSFYSLNEKVHLALIFAATFRQTEKSFILGLPKERGDL